MDYSANAVRERDRRIYQPLVAVYRRGAAALAYQIQQDLDAGRFGTAVMRRRQLAEVERVLSELQDEAVPIAAKVVEEAYKAGAAETARVLAAPLEPAWGAVHREAVTLLVENAVGQLNDMAVQVGRRVEDDYRRIGLHHVTQGIIQGTTRREASSELGRSLVANGTAAVVERDGRLISAYLDTLGRAWKIDRYAEMVIRTSTREAHSQGALARLADLSYDLVQISSHSHYHDVCTQWDGQVFSTTGRSSTYPRLTPEATPPYHPNCCHVLTPGPRE
jgi:hypothetical protein